MNRYDAERTERLLREASEASKPLKDADLTRKIDQAAEHIQKRLDPIFWSLA